MAINRNYFAFIFSSTANAMRQHTCMYWICKCSVLLIEILVSVQLPFFFSSFFSVFFSPFNWTRQKNNSNGTADVHIFIVSLGCCAATTKKVNRNKWSMIRYMDIVISTFTIHTLSAQTSEPTRVHVCWKVYRRLMTLQPRWQMHMLRLLFTLICLEYPHHLRFKFSAAFSYIYDYDICHQTHTFHQMIFYIIFTYLIEWIEKKHELVATRWSPINVHIVMGGVEKLCQSHKLYRIHRQNNK